MGTGTLPSVPWRFLPLRANGEAIGVLGALPKLIPLAPQVQTLNALADQAAMALDRIRLTTQTAQTVAKEDSQKLHTALLSSLSHDLRTPLTAIRGAAETLATRRCCAGQGHPGGPARQHHAGHRAHDQIPRQHHGNGAR